MTLFVQKFTSVVKSKVFRTILGTTMAAVSYYVGHKHGYWFAHELGTGFLASVINTLLYELMLVGADLVGREHLCWTTANV